MGRQRKPRCPPEDPQEMKISTIVLGPCGVGKTALVIHFIQNQFLEDSDPSIEDYYRSEQEIDGRLIIFDVLDTAGEEEFSALREQYIRTGHCFLVCYSLVGSEEYLEDEFHSTLDRIKRECLSPDYVIIVVATKSDLFSGDIESTVGAALARKHGYYHVVTSAKEAQNIEEPFLLGAQVYWGIIPRLTGQLNTKNANKVVTGP
jgi:small GTP-binding protein